MIVDLGPLDRELFARGYEAATGAWVPVARALSLLGGGGILLAAPPLALLSPRLRPALLRIAVACAVTAIVVYLAKLGVGRVRPYLALGVLPRCSPPHDPSFPSGHAAGSMSAAMSFAGDLPRPLRPLPVLVAIAIGWSRVALGVHYPGDVLVGALLGGAIGWAVRGRLLRAP